MEEFAKQNPAVMILLVNLAAGVAAFLFWRMLVRIEKKVDAWPEKCKDCKDELMKNEDFEKNWRPGREDLWNRVNHHKHDAQGNVVIPLGAKK